MYNKGYLFIYCTLCQLSVNDTIYDDIYDTLLLTSIIHLMNTTSIFDTEFRDERLNNLIIGQQQQLHVVD